MVLIPNEVVVSKHKDLLTSLNPYTSYSDAISMKKDAQWENLQEHTVSTALDHWYSTLKHLTKLNYESGMRQLVTQKFVHLNMTLQQFALLNHAAIVDGIKLITTWSECTRQTRAACYISFTRFLNRLTEGLVPRVIPCKEGIAKTFYKVREVVDTNALKQVQWLAFFIALEVINPRDCLIAKVILQGGKRVSEVLSLKVHQIDWSNKMITFKQSKTKGLDKETVITYPETIMEALRKYIGERTGLVFVTRTNKSIPRLQLAKTFAKAGRQAGIAEPVTPHVLRASAVTYLREQGFSDSDIMKVTGHASAEMVHAYDKSSRAENASKKVNLIF